MKKAPECKIGAPCGAKCQPKQFNCPSEKGEDVSKVVDGVVSLIVETASSYSSEEMNSQKNEHRKALYGIVSGLAPQTPKDIPSDLVSSVASSGLSNKSKENGISLQEGAAIALWGGSTYDLINKAVYDFENQAGLAKETGVVVGLHLANALTKMPPYSHQEALERTKRAGFEVREDGFLSRGLYFDDDDQLNRFIDFYEGHLDQQTSFKDASFLATSISTENDFIDAANVKIYIEPKEGGKGRYVDDFKELTESEVLFPPYTEFSVERVKRTKDESYYSYDRIIERAEEIPDKFNNWTEDDFSKYKKEVDITISKLANLNQTLEDLTDAKEYNLHNEVERLSLSIAEQKELLVGMGLKPEELSQAQIEVFINALLASRIDNVAGATIFLKER